MKNLTSLCLSRRPGERVRIGQDVTVEVVETGKGRVRLRITAPVSVRIDRDEVASKRPPEGQQ